MTDEEREEINGYEDKEEERWIKESVKQFKEGKVTAHELIEVEEEEEI